MKLIIYIMSLIDKYNQKKIVNFFESEKIQINTFFDVGAHKGETIKLFSDNFSIKEFYCFEPSPINFNHLIYKFGTEVARQFKELGLHVNFAPVFLE